MNLERLFKVIVMDLTSDNLKLEAELERTINSDLEIITKTEKIKSLLARIVTTEASMKKFTEMLHKTNSNNNNSKPEENGKD